MFSTACPAHVTLSPKRDGQNLNAVLADWPCGWTHFVDYEAPGALRAFRDAVRTVEQCAPEATEHLRHLRVMRDLKSDATAWRALSEIEDACSTAGRQWPAYAVPRDLPMHGPVAEPMSDYIDRAIALSLRAGRMLDRVAQVQPNVSR